MRPDVAAAFATFLAATAWQQTVPPVYEPTPASRSDYGAALVTAGVAALVLAGVSRSPAPLAFAGATVAVLVVLHQLGTGARLGLR